MRQLIEDLLLVARAGDDVENRDTVDLASLASEAWRNVATAEATLDTRTDRTPQADRSRLERLVENLFRNAIEHGGEDVTVVVGDLENGFYIADDGPGIPPDDRDRVFESGYSTSPEGTGFGLRIVEQVANAHGWDVRVTDDTRDGRDEATSERGGARFVFTGVDGQQPSKGSPTIHGCETHPARELRFRGRKRRLPARNRSNHSHRYGCRNARHARGARNGARGAWCRLRGRGPGVPHPLAS